MIGDLNEDALVTASTMRVPLIVPVVLEVEGGLVKRLLHNLTDAELQTLVAKSDPDEGWRWSRALAWQLAGKPPREWEPRKFPLGPAAHCRCGKFRVNGIRSLLTWEMDGSHITHAHSNCMKVAT